MNTAMLVDAADLKQGDTIVGYRIGNEAEPYVGRVVDTPVRTATGMVLLRMRADGQNKLLSVPETLRMYKVPKIRIKC